MNFTGYSGIAFNFSVGEVFPIQYDLIEPASGLVYLFGLH